MAEDVRYKIYSQYLKNKYGEKVYKLPVNLPVTCPNKINGMGGCTFCSEEGTGFEAMPSQKSVTEQLMVTKEKIEKKYKAHKFIAYFQNYTNTYLPLSQFENYLSEAAEVEEVVEISVSTRPDCIHEKYLDSLKKIQEIYKKEITIELGLQTANYHTLMKINRGHRLAEFLGAVLMIQRYGFEICVHVIPNLPYDTLEDVIETARILSILPISQVKLHSLYIAKGTKLEQDYLEGRIQICTREEYYERIAWFLMNLREDMVIERLFSRIPEEDSVFSNWGMSWWKCQEEFLTYMQEHDYYQGKVSNQILAEPIIKAGFLNQ